MEGEEEDSLGRLRPPLARVDLLSGAPFLRKNPKNRLKRAISREKSSPSGRFNGSAFPDPDQRENPVRSGSNAGHLALWIVRTPVSRS